MIRKSDLSGYMKLGVAGLFFCALLASGCGKANLRNATPDEIAANTERVATAGGQPGVDYQSPLLTQEHWQVNMGGEDILSYRLSGHADDAGKRVQHHRIDIDSEYRAKHPAGYLDARFADGTLRPIAHLRQETERCQEFNTMQSGCAFRDRFDFPLSEEELAVFAKTGLSARLVGKSGDLQKIELPATYIQGYLKAVNTN
ncbi:hypothetical protein F6R98_19000 [Candidatus Methylospira mobilis]|uniref:Lipoprotein n=1 Tax=Candidatus Methylospira mobilis TaxID=1808979 RepID=A0A5Q0BQV1_9GAMM|nr:hypothetical protein [Candidatus Methylospira mobilis]QFY44458.1 hypothetical protein F6R98_19000 [Candidatus Methylospira mobilis]WNV06115.1 hypothetical protein RP726_06765 [Candidatus Methylospira mobilis]